MQTASAYAANYDQDLINRLVSPPARGFGYFATLAGVLVATGVVAATRMLGISNLRMANGTSQSKNTLLSTRSGDAATCHSSRSKPQFWHRHPATFSNAAIR